MALADTTGDQQPDARELERILSELLALEREVVELAYVRRSDSLERAREAVRRLGEVGSPQGILSRAPEELGAASQFRPRADQRGRRPLAARQRDLVAR